MVYGLGLVIINIVVILCLISLSFVLNLSLKTPFRYKNQGGEGVTGSPESTTTRRRFILGLLIMASATLCLNVLFDAGSL